MVSPWCWTIWAADPHSSTTALVPKCPTFRLMYFSIKKSQHLLWQPAVIVQPAILDCYIYLPHAIIAIIMQDDDIYCNDIRPLCSWGLREHCIRTSLHWHMFLMIENLSRVTHWWMTTKSTSCLGAEAAGCFARGEPWAARDSHGTDSAGSSPARTCPTTPS